MSGWDPNWAEKRIKSRMWSLFRFTSRVLSGIAAVGFGGELMGGDRRGGFLPSGEKKRLGFPLL